MIFGSWSAAASLVICKNQNEAGMVVVYFVSHLFRDDTFITGAFKNVPMTSVLYPEVGNYHTRVLYNAIQVNIIT